MSNSPLVVCTRWPPNHSGKRTMKIDRITPHCVVGQCTAEGLGDWFAVIKRLKNHTECVVESEDKKND